MKRSLLVVALLLAVAVSIGRAEEQKTLYGPEKFSVTERCGRPNRFTVSVRVPEGDYILRVNSGEALSERVEQMALKVNGQVVIPDRSYAYPCIAAVMHLKKENSLELAIRDVERPEQSCGNQPPRFVTVAVLPLTVHLAEGTYGVPAFDKLKQLEDMTDSIKDRQVRAAATAALDLRNEPEARIQAIRTAGEKGYPSTRGVLTHVYTDLLLFPTNIRAEAGLALGVKNDKEAIPLLIAGLRDEDRAVRNGSGRALTFYPDADTQEVFTKTVRELDAITSAAFIAAMADSGWKPVNALIPLSEDADLYIATLAVRILGVMADPKATDQLLKLLNAPGAADPRVVIAALGSSKDKRAAGPLSRMASDAALRQGKEAALAEALAALGDQTAVPAIEDMIRKSQPGADRRKLRNAYKKLTGKPFKDK